MIYSEIYIPLKDGRTALFRSPTARDAEEMLTYLKTTAGETPYLLRTPEECTMTLPEEEAFLEAAVNAEYDVMILCTVDGKLAGNCRIIRKNKAKNRHRGTVMIALRKDFWNLGIGTAMCEEMIALAKQWGLMQIELEVIEGNTRTMALYHKMGFEVTGFTPDAIQLEDGTLLKEFIMVKKL